MAAVPSRPVPPPQFVPPLKAGVVDSQASSAAAAWRPAHREPGSEVLPGREVLTPARVRALLRPAVR
jgi:hypothetical protein